MTESAELPTKFQMVLFQWDSPAATPPQKTRRTDVCQCAGMNSFQFRKPLSYLPQIVAQMVLSVSF